MFLLALAVVVVGLESRFLWGSWFWWIDDHDQLGFGTGTLSERLTRVPGEIVANGEIINSWLRYRPVYFVERIVVSSAIGERPDIWFLYRQAQFAAIVFLSGLTTLYTMLAAVRARSSSSALTIVILAIAASTELLVATLPAWSDIFTRLGPSEALAMLGLSLSFFGLAKSAYNPRKPQVIFVLIGIVVMAGAKENFAAYGAVIAIIFLVAQVRWWNRTRVGVFATIACIAFPVFILVRVRNAMSASGNDIYGRPTESIPVLDVTRRVLAEIPVDVKILLAIVILLLIKNIVLTRRKSKPLNRLFAMALVAIGIISVNICEQIFYYGSPSALRYDVLSEYLSVLLLATVVIAAVATFTWSSHQWLGIIIAVLLISTSIGTFESTVRRSQTGYEQFVAQALATKLQTNDFRFRLEAIAALSRNQDNAPIILHVSDVMAEWEATASMARFLSLVYGRHVYYVLDHPEQYAGSGPSPEGSRLGDPTWMVLPMANLADEVSTTRICVTNLTNSLNANEC